MPTPAPGGDLQGLRRAATITLRVLQVFGVALASVLTIGALLVVLMPQASWWPAWCRPAEDAGFQPLGPAAAVWSFTAPFFMPRRALRGWRRPAAAAVLLALWFAPPLFQVDFEYGWILRAFATLVAVASLAVWQILWDLTQAPPHARPGA